MVLVYNAWDTIKLCMDVRVKLSSIYAHLFMVAPGSPKPQAILPFSDIGCLCLHQSCIDSYFGRFDR
jgi:hypothetical protein